MIGFILSASLLLFAAAPQAPAAPAVESAAMQHATGTFDVTLTPVPPAADTPPGMPGRMTIDKTFHGGVEGRSVGEMLATMEGASGAYVALERVTATINGRSGTFAMVHVGVVDQGASDLSIKIVPGSGTGEFAGIAGIFHLTIANGGHSYDLEYSLP